MQFLGQANGRLTVKKDRLLRAFQQRKKQGAQQAVLVFCEKSTGAAQFRTQSNANIDDIDRVAGLLAMQCLVRGQEPADFQVLVPAQKIFEGQVVARAQELLEENRALACPTWLSPRQKEILHSVLCNRANKEIASKLNITVRTVKFHISSLLTKFGVSNRSDLARRAAGLLHVAEAAGKEGVAEAVAIEKPSNGFPQPELSPVMLNTTLRVEGKARTVRFSPRVLTA
jgi:DNA-binding CsgD family transcriptional regulator